MQFMARAVLLTTFTARRSSWTTKVFAVKIRFLDEIEYKYQLTAGSTTCMGARIGPIYIYIKKKRPSARVSQDPIV
jgi:hypothetical protein